MEPKIDSRLTLQPFEDIAHYDIQLNLSSYSNPNFNTSRDLIIVVDRSGSMSSCMPKIKAALIDLLDNISLTKIFSTTSFISFQSSPNIFLKKTSEELKKIISTTNASGGTNFSKALKAISESIVQLEEKIEFLQIIFLTDGEIQEAYDRNNDYKNFKDEISNLNSTIKNHTFGFEIHTLGMGNNHDPFILDSLINLGDGKGSYQFLSSNEKIEICFDNIIKEFISQDPFLDFTLSSHSLLFPPINLTLKNVEQHKYETSGFIVAPLEKLQNDDIYLEMKVQNEKEKLHINIERSNDVEKFNLFLWTFERIKQQLEGISSKLLSLSKLKEKQIENYELLAKELSDTKLKLHMIFRKIFRFS